MADSRKRKLPTALQDTVTITLTTNGGLECIPLWDVNKLKCRGKEDTDVSMVMRSLEESLTAATAAIYSQRHNPFLDKLLVKELQLMDAVGFCENVFKSGRFTPQDINSLMIHEEFRRKSYKVNWSHELHQSSVEMAKAGLNMAHDVQEPDRVLCVFCKIELRKWEPYDISWVEHARYAN